LRIQTETPSNILLLVETTVAVAAIVGRPPCFLSATKEEDNILSLSFRKTFTHATRPLPGAQSEHNFPAVGLAFAAESIERTGGYSSDIAEIAINLAEGQ